MQPLYPPPLPQPHYTGRSEFVSHVPQSAYSHGQTAPEPGRLRRHNPKGSRLHPYDRDQGRVRLSPHRPHAHGASGVDFLADSRIQNLKSYAAQARQAGKQTVLLRLSMPSEVSEVVEYADVSFQSELSTIRLLDEAAGRAGKRHNVC